MFRTYVLPKMEYASSVWYPYYIKDVDLIKKVQRKYTKFLPGMFEKSCRERRQLLDIRTLEERRIHVDLILMYKIIHRQIDINFEKYFIFNLTPTTGHPFILNLNPISRANCHKHYFYNRVIKIWNALPENIVMCSKLADFKNEVMCFNVEQHCIGRAFA